MQSSSHLNPSLPLQLLLSFIFWHAPHHILCSSCFQLHLPVSSLRPWHFLCLELNHHSPHLRFHSTLPPLRYYSSLKSWVIRSSQKPPITSPPIGRSNSFSFAFLKLAQASADHITLIFFYFAGLFPGWEHMETRSCVLPPLGSHFAQFWHIVGAQYMLPKLI